MNKPTGKKHLEELIFLQSVSGDKCMLKNLNKKKKKRIYVKILESELKEIKKEKKLNKAISKRQ